MNNKLFMDIHVLQTVPPSCINRDDTGSPKSALYGGVKRARVSSQSWKKAMREMFKDTVPQENRALRTKNLIAMVARELEILGYGDEESRTQAAHEVLEMAGVKIKVDKKTSKPVREALFFLSFAQAKALAEFYVSNELASTDKPDAATKKEAQRLITDTPGVDLALFGRMVAEKPELNYDASAQVAHAISTHAVATEFDYFTAVDDFSDQDHAGAGHIGTAEFNSSTLYRYATVALHDLYKSLGEDTAKTAKEFVRAFVCSMPTGKINSFANHTLPNAVIISMRADQPLNLVGAFEKPVRASDEGFVIGSVKKLMKHSEEVKNDFAGDDRSTFAVGAILKGYKETVSLESALEAVETEVASFFKE